MYWVPSRTVTGKSLIGTLVVNYSSIGQNWKPDLNIKMLGKSKQSKWRLITELSKGNVCQGKQQTKHDEK